MTDVKSTRMKTKFIGVYSRISTKKANFEGKPDLCYDIAYRDEQGKLVYEKVGYRSEGYSATFASQVRAERIRKNRHPEEYRSQMPIPQMTFGEAFEIYKTKHLPTLSHTNKDIVIYDNYIANRFGNVPIKAISPLMVQDFLIWLYRYEGKHTKKKLANATIVHIVSLMNRIFSKLIEWEYVQTNPCHKIKLPKVNNERVRFLTPKEAEQLLDYLENVSCIWYKLAFISLYSGMRLSEILNLKWQDINLQTKTMNIDSKTGQRVVYISNQLKSFLEKLPPKKSNEYIFVNSKHQNIKVQDMGKTFSKAVECLGFNEDISDSRQKVCFHTLRHTFASWLAQADVPLYTIGELLGHKTLQMTKRYAKLSSNTKHEALEKLKNII